MLARRRKGYVEVQSERETKMDVSSRSVSSRPRAAVVTGPGAIEIRDLVLPEPGPGEVRVKLEGCGVCASNLGPWSGPEWMQFPTEPGGLGHEGWGRIDATGEDVENLAVGDRVAMLSYHAYASHDVASADMVVKLPAALEGQPFPGEPLGCAMNIFKRADIQAGHTVAIVGVGFLGALLTQLSVNAGARVIAISRRRESLEVAERMGASHVISMDDHWRIIEEVKSLTGGQFCDRVIEAVGKQWPLDLAGELTRERGRLIIAGYHQDGPRQVNMQLWNWRGLDVINAHERDPAVYIDGIRQAAQAVSEGRLDPSSLYTHRYPLERLDEALDHTRDRPGNFLKALAKMLGTLDELLAEELDGIVIASPSAQHAEQTIQALSAGVAVFCQKPLGRTAKEVAAVVEAARASDRLLGVDLSYRHTRAMAQIKQLLDNKELGDLFAIDLTFHNAYGPDKPWFYDKALSGGGCVIDLGVHLIDLALWALDFPEVKEVSSQLISGGKVLAADSHQVEDYAVATLVLAQGTVVRIACSWRLQAGCDAAIQADFYGTAGGASMRNVNGSFYDFIGERFSGTSRERLVEPPDEWGGRAALAWAERLAENSAYDPDCANLIRVAEALDRIYAGK
eukprot:g9878.t1